MSGTKVCSRCGVEKILECFAPAPANKDGRRGVCHACLNNARKQKRATTMPIEPFPRRAGLRGSQAAASSRRIAKMLKSIHAEDLKP